MPDFIESLLRRMSLTEKVGQLSLLMPGGSDTTGAGAAAAGIENRIRRGEVGFLPGGGDLKQLARWQKIAVEESSHRIPAIFTLDVIHGHRTIFPLPLALAGSFDMDLVRRTARVAAEEAAAAGVTLAWAPMLDVSRDARWGRCAESPGEDPVLGAAFARAMVEGYQRTDLARPDATMACAKHFAGYGFAEGGRDYNAVDASPYRMHNVVLPPFKAAVEARCRRRSWSASMISRAFPAAPHRELLHDLLRQRWGFDGLIVSDYTAIPELVNHGVAADAKEATLLAFRAGIDVDLVSECYLRHLPELVGEGRLTEADVDTACRRVLTAKQRLGLFDDPYGRLDEARRQSGHLDRRQPPPGAGGGGKVVRAAEEQRRAAAVNARGPLPWSGRWPTAASICRAPGRSPPAPEDSVTAAGRHAAAAAAGPVLHAQGANIVDDPNIAARLNVFGEIAAIDARPPEALIAEAVAVDAPGGCGDRLRRRGQGADGRIVHAYRHRPARAASSACSAPCMTPGSRWCW